MSLENPEMFQWSKHFEVGVKEIDRQHKKLVEILNSVCTNICDVLHDPSTEEHNVAQLISELVDYTVYHFEYEEKEYAHYFSGSDFFSKHKERHDNLVSVAAQFQSEYANNPKSFEIETFVSLLTLWLSEHILTEDMLMFTIISKLDDSNSFEEAVSLAKDEMEKTKNIIASTITSMMNVTTALSLNLRREIINRAKTEEALLEEIAIRKKVEDKLKHLASHDQLTGLANRKLFQNLSNLALSYAKRNNSEQSILFIDLDGFKNINDNYGHQIGDDVLIVIANRLQDCIRESDIVARVGGDEFVIYLGGRCSTYDTTEIANKIITSISMPIKLDGPKTSASVGASIGISIYPSDAKSVDSLIQKADIAMYAVKKSGKSAYKLYSEL